MSIYNPFMPATSFLSRATLGGGGGDGGGGDSSPPATISGSFTQDKTAADATTAAANEQYGGGYQTATTFSDGKQGYSTIQTPASGGGDDRPAPAPVPVTPTPLPTPPVQPEPTPVAPPPTATPVAPPPAPTGPDFTTPSPVVSPTDQTPEAIPTDVSEDVVTVDVPQPTYTPVEPVTPAAVEPTPTGSVQINRSQITQPTATQPSTGTFSVPTATAGLSAVPKQVTVRPNYTGTTMANLTAPSQGVQGVQQVPYMNRLGQTLTVTEVNGSPITYVPPGYIRARDMQAQMKVSMAEGGSVQDMKLDGMYRMATKFLGYTGPKTREALAAFRNSSPAVAAKMRGYDNAMARGGLMTKGYQKGGVVPRNTVIAGQPHRLAYVNPEEEKMLKAAGGAGVPSYGGIPAYFSIGPATDVAPGTTTTDPMTGTVYTSDGTNWTMTKTGTGPMLTGGVQVPLDPSGLTAFTERLNKLTGQTEAGTQQAATGSNQYRPQVGTMDPLTTEQLANLNTNERNLFLAQRAGDTFQAQVDALPSNITNSAIQSAQQRQRQAQQPVTPLTTESLAEMQSSAVQQTMQPRQAAVQQLVPQAADFIAPTAGMTAPVAPMAEAATLGQVQLAQPVTPTPAALVTPATAAGAVQQVTKATEAAQGAVSPEAQVQAAEQMQSSVTGLEAAQGTAIMMTNPVQREIQAGELISGVADAEKAAAFTEQVQAAQATPTKQATVQGQLEGLMAQFEGGATPSWAAGAMRAATATMAARGLGASSLAGQAVIQAAMESALPIAQMDAQTVAQFEVQNLSNRQQRAMLAAQQRAEFLGMEFNQAFQARVANSARIGDIANMNFTAEQQVALENSRAANTVNLQNLNNRQAKVMAEAAALSQLDMANLSNRQQAAVQNAQNFMQMDLTNLSNQQQTEMFKAQQNIQAIFTDQAAENAAQQINAASENQTNQFFASLASQTSQFNATQTNAIEQFNINSVNALRRFNSEIQQQRDLFNAQNGLVIAQANAQWRQNIATINNAAINESNREFAQTMNSLTAKNMDAIWQRERDIMSYAVQTANNNADRATEILKQKLANESTLSAEDAKKTSALMEIGGAVARDIIGGIFNF